MHPSAGLSAFETSAGLGLACRQVGDPILPGWLIGLVAGLGLAVLHAVAAAG
ncbi:hypothetical protein [Roseicella aquatilis]|uniref:hypothetical protein n=1 Tax=Roseicella aquatilis TaxID=2527868 RepID=UPI001404DDD3|nr:hypothetical protein [Roseicella aquatilis]